MSDTNNMLLWGGVAAAILVVGAAIWYFHKKSSADDATKPAAFFPRSMEDLADPTDDGNDDMGSTTEGSALVRSAAPSTSSRNIGNPARAYHGSNKGNSTIDQTAHFTSGVRASEFAEGAGDGTRKLVADASQVISDSLRAQRKLADNSAFAKHNSARKALDDGGRSLYSKRKLAPIDDSLMNNVNPLLSLPATFQKVMYSNTRDRGFTANAAPIIHGSSENMRPGHSV